jgi:mono/diheme cytochrome c family protein
MKRIGILVWSMTFVACGLAPSQMWAQEIGEPAKGLLLAQQVCAECHAIDKRQASSPNAAAPRFEAIANVSGMSPLALTVVLQTPHRSMPNLILDPDELRNIVAYILSLK